MPNVLALSVPEMTEWRDTKNLELGEDNGQRDDNANTNEEAMAASSAATEGGAAAALRSVIQRVDQAAERSARGPDRIRIVAVSKTKPVSLLRQVYDAGHRCFGEN